MRATCQRRWVKNMDFPHTHTHTPYRANVFRAEKRGRSGLHVTRVCSLLWPQTRRLFLKGGCAQIFKGLLADVGFGDISEAVLSRWGFTNGLQRKYFKFNFSSEISQIATQRASTVQWMSLPESLIGLDKITQAVQRHLVPLFYILIGPHGCRRCPFVGIPSIRERSRSVTRIRKQQVANNQRIRTRSSSSPCWSSLAGN